MTSTHLRLDDPTCVGEARRAASALAERLGLDETTRGRAAIVATEAATNVLRHAGGGSLMLRAVDDASGTFLEVVAVDSGPGIPNLDAALSDGYSTGGSAGEGLGAIRRMACTFDLWTARGQGTVVLARVGQEASLPIAIAGDSINAPHETVCGDGWGFSRGGARVRVFMVDGLGHGRGANEAAERALEAFRAHPQRPLAELMDETHRALRSTRGAAVGVAEIDLETRKLDWVGVGNIAGTTVTDELRTQSVVSQGGIVGHNVRNVQVFHYDWPAKGMAIFHSDGLVTSWSLAKYPGAHARHPAVVAALLLRDSLRGKDDATVVVVSDTAHRGRA